MNWTLKGILFSFAVVSAISCTSLGPAFQNEQVRSNEATVYIYRPAKFANSMGSPSIFIDDQKVFDIANGGYRPVSLKPGKHKVRVYEKMWGDVDETVEFQVAGGNTYYLRFELFKSARDRSAAIGTMGAVGGVVSAADAANMPPAEKLVDTRAMAVTAFKPTLFFIKESIGSKEIVETKLIR